MSLHLVYMILGSKPPSCFPFPLCLMENAICFLALRLFAKNCLHTLQVCKCPLQRGGFLKEKKKWRTFRLGLQQSFHRHALLADPWKRRALFLIREDKLGLQENFCPAVYRLLVKPYILPWTHHSPGVCPDFFPSRLPGFELLPNLESGFSWLCGAATLPSFSLQPWFQPQPIPWSGNCLPKKESPTLFIANLVNTWQRQELLTSHLEKTLWLSLEEKKKKDACSHTLHKRGGHLLCLLSTQTAQWQGWKEVECF